MLRILPVKKGLISCSLIDYRADWLSTADITQVVVAWTMARALMLLERMDKYLLSAITKILTAAISLPLIFLLISFWHLTT